MDTSAGLHRAPIPAGLLRVLVLLALSVFLNYVDRSNLSIAAPQLKDELGLSSSELGVLLAAFFWTYAPFQLLSGWLVDRVDVNFVIAAGFFVWSAATGMTGLLHGFTALLAARLVLGAGESVAYPSYSKILARHFPEEHRGLANSVIASGLTCGPAFGMFAGGLLVATFGWRSFFIALGFVSFAWLLPWWWWMPRGGMAEQRVSKGVPTLIQFLRQRSAWGTSAGLFASNYLSYTLITWLPFYLVRERHFSLGQMADVAGAAYLAAAAFATFCGWASDRWIQAGSTPTLVRKTFTSAGAALAGLCLFASAAVSSSSLSVVLLIAAVMFFGMLSSNIWAVTQTLAGPEAAGRWTGFQNFVGNLAGMIAPAITGFVVDRTGHFLPAFSIAAAVSALGAVAWIFVVGPIRPVQWSTERRTTALAS